GADAVIALATLSIAWTQFGDGRFLPEGGVRFTAPYASEALFHSAIAQELRHHLPIEMPAGLTLPYHVGYNLLAALTADATGADMLDVHYRLLPILLAPLAALSAIAFVESIGAAGLAALAGAAALFFIDDLSWIFGVLGIGHGRSWNLRLGVPLLYGLHHNRGFLAGVALLFPAMIVAARYLRDGRSRDLAVAAALSAALFELKVSFFLTLVPAIAAGAGLAAVSGRGGSAHSLLVRGAALCGMAAALVLPLVLPILGGSRNALALAPLEVALLPLIRLGAVPGDPIHGATSGEIGLAPRLAGLFLLVVGTLGVRALGFSALADERRRDQSGIWLAIGVVAVGAAAITLATTPPAQLNVVYFWGASLAVLAVLAGIVAAEALGRMRLRARSMMALALAVLALPGTVQFLWVERSVRARAVLTMPSGSEEIVRLLGREAHPGDVLLEPPGRISLLAALVPVRPVIAWPQWFANTFGEEAIQARLDDAAVFFSAAEATKREAVIDRYRVRWVWAPRGAECVPFARLTLVAENAAGRLFSVRALTESRVGARDLPRSS
ncbi:MAG: hypothetical protein ACREQQ_09765, partial [Candidatus Binatia bacterium]